MTPAERQAKIAAAEALLNDVAADETAAQANAPAALPSFLQKNPNAAQTTAASAGIKAYAAAVVAPVITGPGGNTRPTGQPSVSDTMKKVWSIMKGNKG